MEPPNRRPSFRLLPFLPPRFPLPITSTRTPSKFVSEIKPSAFKRAPAARVLTFKFSVTVSAVPERSSTTSDASSVIPSSSTRGTSPWSPVSAQPFGAAPPDAFPTPTGGTVPPPWPRKSTTPGAQDCVGGVVKKRKREFHRVFPMRPSCLNIGIALSVSNASIRASEAPAAPASSSLAMNMPSRAHRLET